MLSDSGAAEVARLLASQLAAFLALLLAASAVHKGLRFAYTQRVVHDFAGVPRAAAAGAALSAVLLESLAGILLFLPAYRLAGGLLAALIWGVYLALIVRAIGRGLREVDCGCSFGTASFGTASVDATRHPLGAFEVARNALLVVFALLVGGSAQNAPLRIAASQVLAAGALLALYGAFDQVMALGPLRRGETA
jgi:Methylamine utilisation protein MauE